MFQNNDYASEFAVTETYLYNQRPITIIVATHGEIDTSKINELSAIGFHEFFRYAIPGYGLVAVALVTIWVFEPSRFPSLDLQNIAIWAISGPFMGFLIHHAFYYPVWTLYYKRCSRAYKEVGQIIEGISRPTGSKLAEYYDNNCPSLSLVRCVWDFVYFSEKNRDTRDRIQFLLTIVHSIGATLFSIWFGFGFGLFYTLLPREELSFDASVTMNPMQHSTNTIIEWYWRIGMLVVLIFVTGGLLYSFFDRKRLAENQEFLLVLDNRDDIRREVLKKINPSHDPFFGL